MRFASGHWLYGSLPCPPHWAARKRLPLGLVLWVRPVLSPVTSPPGPDLSPGKLLRAAACLVPRPSFGGTFGFVPCGAIPAVPRTPAWSPPLGLPGFRHASFRVCPLLTCGVTNDPAASPRPPSGLSSSDRTLPVSRLTDGSVGIRRQPLGVLWEDISMAWFSCQAFWYAFLRIPSYRSSGSRRHVAETHKRPAIRALLAARRALPIIRRDPAGCGTRPSRYPEVEQ
jgi:hypothetical protein